MVAAVTEWASEEALVARVAGQYWHSRLKLTTCVQIQDVRQEAWLSLARNPRVVGGMRPQRIWWDLQREYGRRGNIPHRTHTELAPEAGGDAMDWTLALRAGAGAAGDCTPEEREYLHQNLWGIGTRKTVEALLWRLEGAPFRGREPGVDRNTLTRALPNIRKAFPTKRALLGPSLALWLHPTCRRALTALRTGGAWEASADALAFYERQLQLGWQEGKR